jgi:hypothetical protein
MKPELKGQFFRLFAWSAWLALALPLYADKISVFAAKAQLRRVCGARVFSGHS